MTVIVGPNASGKTNIIESLFACAVGKSFRARHDRDMIAWGSDVGRIICETADSKLELVLTSGMVQGKKTPLKKFLVNGVSRRMVDFVGNIRAVLFWPEHLELVIDRPSVRRDYLDSVLIQADREYRRTLVSYQRGVRQRNRVLDAIAEGHATRGQLPFWDQLLIKTGGYITDARAAYIEYVNAQTEDELPYRIQYDKSVISENRLQQYKDAEVGARATLVGPHRDDFSFEFRASSLEFRGKDQNEYMDLASYGSRGQQRLAVLWLKLAELSYLRAKTQDKPILLLDDIFSELDEEHQERVMQLVEDHQTIITTALTQSAEGYRKRHPMAKIITLMDEGEV